MFPSWPSTKIVQVIMIRQKTWLPGSGAYFPYISIYKSLKIFFSETNGPISIQPGRNVSLVTLYKDCSSRHDSSKNMAARGRGLFFLYIYIENFKNLLVRNSWTKFNVTWQECCFGDLLPRLFKPSWYVKHHGPQWGRGLFFVYICIENFKILLVKYPRPISILLGWNVALVTLYQDCTSNHDSSKNMAAMGWGLFSLYI